MQIFGKIDFRKGGGKKEGHETDGFPYGGFVKRYGGGFVGQNGGELLRI